MHKRSRSHACANTLLTKSSPTLNDASVGNTIITHSHIVLRALRMWVLHVRIYYVHGASVMYPRAYYMLRVAGGARVVRARRTCIHMCTRQRGCQTDAVLLYDSGLRSGGRVANRQLTAHPRRRRPVRLAVGGVWSGGPPPNSSSPRRLVGGVHTRKLWRVCTIY